MSGPGPFDKLGTSPFMSRALELARELKGRTSPNPSVGAVLVRDGVVVGEGRYEGRGTSHAEAVAIAAAGGAARGATLFVTLEPCAHHGSTPPCADAVIAAGIAEVRFSHVDPDARVSGEGRRKLESAGVAVAVGEGEAEARAINEAYLHHRETGRPFVVAKFAASLDGKIAATSGDSRWVSGPETLAWSHELRTRIDAIAVGVNTVLVDDPQLTARPVLRRAQDEARAESLAAQQPLRVVLDSRGRTPRDAKAIACGTPALVATTGASSEAWRRELSDAGATVAVLASDAEGRVSLPALLDRLGADGAMTLLIEGGGVLLGSCFDERLVNKVHAVIAPIVIGGAGAPVAVAGRGAERMADALRLRDVTTEHLGGDLLVTGYPA